jgi:hypothetical protein
LFIKNHINKVEFKDQEENTVEEVPDELRNIHGFTAIPPFLRVFPSKLALQNINKKKYDEEEEESELLQIKNKREIEDKLICISLKEHTQKADEDPQSLLSQTDQQSRLYN